MDKATSSLLIGLVFSIDYLIAFLLSVPPDFDFNFHCS
jgi:hypothetical protein